MAAIGEQRFADEPMTTDVTSALSTALQRSDGSLLLDEIFGTDVSHTDAAASIVDIASVAGRPVGVKLVRLGSGIVVGFDLAEGSSVVVKVHRPHIVARLGAVLRAQRELTAAGVPVPESLVHEAIPVGSGAATIESWLAHGDTVDVRPAPRRQAIAECAVAITGALTPVENYGALAPGWTGRFPPPHSPIFNFDATAAGAGWIDELADVALDVKVRLVDTHDRSTVAGHGDLRPENVLLDARGVSAVYDLDSLVLDAEPWLVGGVARAFSTNWSLSDPMLPTVNEISAYVNDYELARGTGFTDDERLLAAAGTLHALAYSARCEHSLYPSSVAPWGPGWRHLLRTFAAVPIA